MHMQVKRDATGERRFYFGNRLSLEAEGYPGYTRAEISKMISEFQARLSGDRLQRVYAKMRGAS